MLCRGWRLGAGAAAIIVAVQPPQQGNYGPAAQPPPGMAPVGRQGPPPGRSSGKKIGLIVGLSAAGLVLVALMIGLMFGWSSEPEPGDEQLVVTTEELVEHFGLELYIDPEAVTFERNRYVDGTYSIDYEYEAPDGTFYTSTSIAYEHSEQNAKNVFTGASLGFTVAFDATAEGVERQPTEGIAQGDRHETGLIVSQGQSIGAYAVVQMDETVFTFTVTGFGISAQDAHDLLAPHLSAVAEL